MSTILDYFTAEKNISAEIKRNTTSLVAGVSQKTENTIDTYLSIFYLGSQAENLVAEKLRQAVAAVAIFDYGIDIKQNDIVIVNSKRYILINLENVALRNEALVAALKEIN